MRIRPLVITWGALLALCFAAPVVAQQASPLEMGEQLFGTVCAGCHGTGANGGERGPSLVNSRSVRGRSEAQLQQLIREGTSGGMPPFALPQEQLQALAQWIRSLNVSAFEVKPAGDVAAGEQFFFGKGQCSSCHMIAGRGGSNGPDLSDVGRQLALRDLQLALDNPTLHAGSRTASNCPSWAWCPQSSWSVANVRLRNGSTLRGFLRGQGKHDLQLQTSDGRLQLLKESEYLDVTREPGSSMPPLKASALERRDLVAYLSARGGITEGPLAKEWSPLPAGAFERILQPKGEWPTYHGDMSGNRHSPLNQINTQNIGNLRLQWSYFVPATGLQTTPVVIDGVMYVSSPNRVAALDSRSGREIWSFQYRDPAASGPPPAITIASLGGGGSVHRGVAVLGNRVFFTSANAHLLCLNRLTGGLMWDVPMHRGPGRSSGPVAPLVVGDLVIAGMSGGDSPLLGFVAAFKATTGEEVWRFNPIPKPGERGSETWGGSAIANGGGATWLTGSYDVESGVLYWATGQPYPPTEGAQREGDNLYTNCVVALDPKTGKMLWYYQFTPHDLHDWDANEPLLLVNARYQGRDRKLMLQANRNGFFYVLDRTNGELLLGQPFVKKMTWASGIGKDGRPQLLEGNDPTREGSKSCPAVRGATNWYSTAFHPGTRLFYVMAVEDCTIYRQGQGGMYVPYRDPSDPPSRHLRALDIETGKIVWEIPQVGPPEFNYSGVLTTAGNLLFYGETGGSFAAVDAKSGKPLWHVETNQLWRASPMTYMVNGKQYVA
ncbi:MAG: PQQ-binding-like beta-propeller repeat protein, partial [Candidatus Korobacteraceae bacterium]